MDTETLITGLETNTKYDGALQTEQNGADIATASSAVFGEATFKRVDLDQDAVVALAIEAFNDRQKNFALLETKTALYLKKIFLSKKDKTLVFVIAELPLDEDHNLKVHKMIAYQESPLN